MSITGPRGWPAFNAREARGRQWTRTRRRARGCMSGGVPPCGLSAGAPAEPVESGPVHPWGCSCPLLSGNIVRPVPCRSHSQGGKGSGPGCRVEVAGSSRWRAKWRETGVPTSSLQVSAASCRTTNCGASRRSELTGIRKGCGRPRVGSLNFAFDGPFANGVDLFFVFYFVSTAIHAIHMLVGIAVLATHAVATRPAEVAEMQASTAHATRKPRRSRYRCAGSPQRMLLGRRAGRRNSRATVLRTAELRLR